MNRPIRFFCAVLVALLPFASEAEHTRFWRESEFSDFQRGTPAGVAIRSDGKIAPAPQFGTFADADLSVLWALKLDPQGRLYAAGGSDAKVLRFDEKGKSSTVFESPDLAAQAIAFDPKGNLFVGTSPDGKIYKVTPDGAKSVFFEPKAKYIWALAVDSQGDLFAGTGDKGEIFAVAPDGKGKLFYTSDQRHARSLAFDRKGNLLVGTEPDGRILRIPITARGNAAPDAGTPFVVYETRRKEVTALLADTAGTLYAAAIGDKSHNTSAPVGGVAQPTIQIAPAAPAGAQGAGAGLQNSLAAAQSGVPAAALGTSASGAEVVKIAPDDSPETLWSSGNQIVLALALEADGKLLLGTGNHGEIIRLEGDGVYSQIEQTSAMQVTGLAASPDGKVYAATANPGKIFAMGPGSQPDGTFESNTYDTSIFSRWGRISWWGEDGGAQGRVRFFVRTGNTANPEKNWSPWTGPYTSSEGQDITAPSARFVQWKAEFSGSISGTQPKISWVSLAFQPKNVAPAIDGVAVEDPGVRLAGFGGAVAVSSGASPQLRAPVRADASSSSDGEALTHPTRTEAQPQVSEDRGYQSVYWAAHDDNDDNLIYSVYYRGEDENSWRLLKDKLTTPYYSWDTTTMPDGAYYLKIVASDAPSNPPSDALTAERESDRFQVGNTPPQINQLRAQIDGGTATLNFQATSTSGSIARATYSVDSSDWLVVFPLGLLSDAPLESYGWNVSGLPPGEHTVSVRVSDRFGNETAAKTTFIVGAAK